MNRVIVIGAGASGLMAAITAARCGALVTILEAMEKPGKKILITGNGKCNLTNTDFTREDVYRSDDPKIVADILDTFSYQDTMRFFREIGLLLHEKNKGIYPLTDQSSSVVDLLVSEAKRLKVKLKCTEKVQSIQKVNNEWKVKTSTWEYTSDAVILSCGSKSYPLTGSDGSGYHFAEKLKLLVKEPLPALVPLITKESWISKLAGIRSSSHVTMTIDGECTLEESGEVQWTEYGVSGIVIFQLSRYAVKALKEKKHVSLRIDVLPDHSTEMLYDCICSQKEYKNAGDILSGILPKKMIPVVLSLASVKAEEKGEQLSEEKIRKIIQIMKGITCTVKGSKSFDQAQVCQGGVSLTEIVPATMETRKRKGLYLTGELLDVDGICGGYNLQWAWSTGYIAGKASAEQ